MDEKLKYQKIISVDKNGLIFDDGTTAKAIVISPDGKDVQWEFMQNASIEEYKVHHEVKYPPDVMTILKHFTGFLSRYLKGTVLDVGCGISPTLPLYAKGLNITYIGLDPFPVNNVREYPFICSKIEDILFCLEKPVFDGAIFATSLDHIRDIHAAGAALKKICKPGAKIVFWIGLHDPKIVGKTIATGFFEDVLTPLSFFRCYTKMLRCSFFTFPKLFFSLKKRELNLNKGLPLDELHFHYFTRMTARAALNGHFGKIIEELEVPGTNSIFYVTLI
ncbi:MAG: methyltransferase domain-containing protein [Smithella sp.]